MMFDRRFPPPWSVEELDACFVVIDGAGQKLAYVYFEDEPGRRSAAKLLMQAPRSDLLILPKECTMSQLCKATAILGAALVAAPALCYG
jgi:hypothetical protein